MELPDILRKELFGTPVELDAEATRSWYANAAEWDCDCTPCRNFVKLARLRKLPAAMLEALDALGIAPERATYVCALDAGRYQVSYRIAGKILAERGSSAPFPGGTALCWHDPYPYGAPGFPEPHFDLEFEFDAE